MNKGALGFPKQEPSARSFKITGKSGATAAPPILAGGTASGAPTTGRHVAREIVIDETGEGWYCTVGGTPGTWVTMKGAGGGGSVATDTIFDAKGDLPVGTGADAASRLAVGTNGHVLTADSTQATGLKWSAAGASAGSVGGPPLLRVKTADESVTSSITLQDDNHLTIPVGASEVWLLDYILFATGAATGDIAIGLAGPASTTAVFGGFGLTRAATTNESGVRTNATTIAGSVSFGLVASETNVISVNAYVSTTASGDVVLQWAQRVSDGTATSLIIGSHLKAYRLS